MGERPARASITSFRGDFRRLAGMMRQSWETNKEQPLRYTEEFLRSSFEYPGSSFSLAPSIYLGDEIAAFVAGFPRNVRFHGRPVRLLLNSFLTAALEVRKAGHGLMVWRNLIDRARAEGYEGTINFCVEGDEMNALMPRIAQSFQLNTHKIYTIEYLSRFVRPSAESPPAPISSVGIEMFLDLAAGIPDSVPLARTWTYPEAEWHCRGRSGALAVATVEGDRRGMLTGYAMEVGKQPARVAIMEDLLWGNLDAAERNGLLRRFVQAAAAQGALSVSCPILGYSSTETLIAAGFRPSRRTLQTWLTLWNGDNPVPVPSLYVDVL